MKIGQGEICTLSQLNNNWYVDIGKVSISCRDEWSARELFKATENYGQEVIESD